MTARDCLAFLTHDFIHVSSSSGTVHGSQREASCAMTLIDRANVVGGVSVTAAKVEGTGESIAMAAKRNSVRVQ